MNPRRVAMLAARMGAVLIPGTARAHASLGIGVFYDGAAHPLRHPDLLLALLAAALWAVRCGRPAAGRVAATYLATAIAALTAAVLWRPEPAAELSLLLPLGTAALAAALALLRGPRLPSALLAAPVGAWVGWLAAGEPPGPPGDAWRYAAGLATGMFATVVVPAGTLLDRRGRAAQLAPRIALSWIAAASALSLAARAVPRS